VKLLQPTSSAKLRVVLLPGPSSSAAAYALSANVNRRMLTKGQRAMITVQAKLSAGPTLFHGEQ
jgi:hypothetical protein